MPSLTCRLGGACQMFVACMYICIYVYTFIPRCLSGFVGSVTSVDGDSRVLDGVFLGFGIWEFGVGCLVSVVGGW